MTQNLSIKPYLNELGRITKFPRKHKTKVALLAYLAGQFEMNRIYSEQEINAICEHWHTFGDYFLLRRELVDYGFLCRKQDGSRNWRVQPSQSELLIHPE